MSPASEFCPAPVCCRCSYAAAAPVCCRCPCMHAAAAPVSIVCGLLSSTMATIKSFDGNEFDGYLSLPASGYGPGIVVIQEIFGVNSNVRSVADWYAAHGFVALCPDLFWRIEPGIELTDKGDDWKRGI